MNANEIKKIKQAVKAIDKAHTEANKNFDMLCDAHNDNMIFNAHTEALKIHAEMCVNGVLLTKKERNALKRTRNEEIKVKSLFNVSVDTTTQAYRIDKAVEDFHTFNELLQLDTLKDVSKYRLRSHIKFLDTQMCHICKKEVNGAAFRYVLV